MRMPSEGKGLKMSDEMVKILIFTSIGFGIGKLRRIKI